VTAGTIYRWEFTRDGRAFTVNIRDEVVVNDRMTLMALSRAGMGLGSLTDRQRRPERESSSRTWRMDSGADLFLYFPAHS
jgi:hypothetical protein